MILAPLLLASIVAAQSNPPGISSNPGGVIPAGLRQPNVTGFNNPVVLPARGGYAICVTGTVPVTASATNVKINYNNPANQSVITETVLDLITAGSPFPQQINGGNQTVSGTYNISATMCMPANGTKYPNTVQFLTHGVGFDKYYWDWAPGYSYADFAAVQGYVTFFYDRLGTGMSSKPDPIQTVQTPVEVAIAIQLIRMLRAGMFGGYTFTRVVGVGHSLGSIITNGITNQQPTLLDAAVLTGFTIDTSGLGSFLAGANWAIASQNQPYRFSSLSNGYIVAGSASANQLLFFKAQNFDPSQLSLADATKGPASLGELFTTTAVVGPASNYTGAIAIVNGDADLPFCLGNCTYPTNKGAAVIPALYPRARNSTNNNYIAPNTGHGINLHYSATTTYNFIQNFIKANVQ